MKVVSFLPSPMVNNYVKTRTNQNIFGSTALCLVCNHSRTMGKKRQLVCAHEQHFTIKRLKHQAKR